ncbi:hypothetical protein, partial [Streptococcus pseudopneumoniae]|uniref:hypothetical protein n=1 Tax=Streptococcus pseudopneumoniae TaxID=257758 RepID=UPI001BB0E6C9
KGSAMINITVGPENDPFGRAVSLLSIVRPKDTGGKPFLVALSSNQAMDLPIKRHGNVKPIKGRLSEKVAVYRVPPDLLRGTARVGPQGQFTVALCDKFGQVLDISNDTVYFDPAYMGQLFLVVMHDPFEKHAVDSSYILEFEAPPYTEMK